MPFTNSVSRYDAAIWSNLMGRFLSANSVWRTGALVLKPLPVERQQPNRDMDPVIAILPADDLAMLIQPGKFGAVRGRQVVAHRLHPLRQPSVDRGFQRIQSRARFCRNDNA